MHLDAVEFETSEIEDAIVSQLHPGQILLCRAWSLKQQAVPVFKRLLIEMQTGIDREVRCTDQFALQIVGPAVHRTDDVSSIARTLQHDRLAMAADIRQQFDLTRLDVALPHQQSGMVEPLEATVIVQAGHHQRMARIARPRIKKLLFLQRKQFLVGIP